MMLHTVDGKEISITFEVGGERFRGILIKSIFNKVMRREHLSAPTFLFEFAVDNGLPQYSHTQLISQFSDPTPTSVMIGGVAVEYPHIAFELEVKADEIAPNIVTLGLKVRSRLDKPTFLRLVFPKLLGLTTGDPAEAVGMIPMEIGSVVHLLPMLLEHHPIESPDYEGTMGMPYLREAKRIGLPTSMNTMELAAICDGSRGGIFFADLDNHVDADGGAPPIQFTLSARELAGFNVAFLQKDVFTKFSDLAIGVTHEGDWHDAVDFYVRQHRRRNSWQPPLPPAWFRDTAAIYTFTGGGAGGIYLGLPHPPAGKEPLASRISHYKEIATTLWNEAQELGTNVIYLWDYWRRPTPVHPEERHQIHQRQPDLAYWNKGDYVPRPDLGTEEDFKQAIAEVHEKGGRVILYVEPFIIDVDSDVARVWKPAWAVHDFPSNCAPDQSWPKKQGEHLAGRFPADPPLHVIAPPHEAGWCWKIYYPYYHTMVPDLAEWQAHLLAVVRRLTHDYNVDGIMLDSYGWQMNLPMRTETLGVVIERWPFRWNAAVLDLMDRIRDVMGSNKVLLVETPSGPVGWHCHGGLSSDFYPGIHQQGGLSNQSKITGSPVRYGMPSRRYFSNGRDLNELNQIYAAGHGLALCGTQFTDPKERAYVAHLVRVRQSYADTLIRGQQLYQPVTGNPDVIAYYYAGGRERIITVVNTSEANFTGQLQLRQQLYDSTWVDLARLLPHPWSDTPTFKTVSGRLMPVTVAGHTLRVLRRIARGPVIYGPALRSI
jgi:hypothetical protein